MSGMILWASAAAGIMLIRHHNARRNPSGRVQGRAGAAPAVSPVRIGMGRGLPPCGRAGR